MLVCSREQTDGAFLQIGILDLQNPVSELDHFGTSDIRRVSLFWIDGFQRSFFQKSVNHAGVGSKGFISYSLIV